MRAVLLTGKGGVGKTTAAAGLAALAARTGRKTLVVSADLAPSLGDALGAGVDGVPRVGAEPVEVAPALWALQVDPRGRLQRSWQEVHGYLVEVLDAAGVDPVEAEELLVPPGVEEVLALLELRDQVRSGRFEALVVDCAPSAQTLRLLTVPEVLRWYLRRVLPLERRLTALVSRRGERLPAPGAGVLAAAERLSADLADARRLLTEATSTVRLVLTPERSVVADARRAWTSLALHGFRVDGVIANRVIPPPSGPGRSGAWQAGWAAAQAEVLTEVERSFAPLPVRRAPYLPAEPVGVDALLALAEETYAHDTGDDPGFATTAGPEPLAVAREGEGYVLRLAMPLTEPGDLDLARSQDDLVLTVGATRRVLTLPSVLRRCQVTGARLREGTLTVTFVPDPALWPQR